MKRINIQTASVQSWHEKTHPKNKQTIKPLFKTHLQVGFIGSFKIFLTIALFHSYNDKIFKK